MKRYLENINFKKIYSIMVWCVYAAFGAFFMAFSLNGKTKMLFFALILFWIASLMFCLTDMKNYLVTFFFFMTMWLFLFSRPMIDYIRTGSFNTYTINTYQFVFFILILSMAGLMAGAIIAKHFKLRNRQKTVDVTKETRFMVHTKYVRASAICVFLASYPFYVLRIVERYLYRRETTYYDYFATFQSKLPYVVYLISVFTFISMCVYLATKPRKKYAFMVLCLYIFANAIYLLIGTRNPFILSALFSLVYYFMRHFEDKKEVWVGKIEKTLMIVATPLLMLFMGAMNYIRDDADIAANSFTGLMTDFIYKQGTSFGVLAKGYLYNWYLPKRSITNYTFGPLIDYIYRGNIGKFLFGTHPLPETNSLELALESNSYAHNLSYVVLEGGYLDGHGIGSSFVMEVFTDYRYIGVFIFSIILGMLCVGMMKSVYKNKVIPFAISLVVLENLFFTPRASFMSSFMPLFTLQFWAVMFIIFFGAGLLERYNKRDYNLEIEKERINA